GQSLDPSADVDSQAAWLPVDRLHFSRVTTDSCLQSDRGRSGDGGEREPDRPGRTVEGGEEAIACRISFAAVIARQQATQQLPEPGQVVVPAAIPRRDGMLGRYDDVDHDDGREDAIEVGLLRLDRAHECVETMDHVRDVADERRMVCATKCLEPRTGDP